MPGHWSEEQRQAARKRIFNNKPWLASTGPRSDRGKAIAARNSTSLINQIRLGLWVYLPNHRILARTDTDRGKNLIEFYRQNNLPYGDRSFLINGLNLYGDRWLDTLI